MRSAAWGWRAPAALAALLLAGAGAARGGQQALCSQPGVFPGAAINVVILPYATPAAPGAELGILARKFTLMTQLEVLLSLLDLQSVGVTRMVAPTAAERRQCTPELVAQRLLGELPGGVELVRPGGALILLSGSFYEEGEDLFLQSFVAFTRRDARPEQRFTVEGVDFAARLPFDGVALPPQRLGRVDIDLIAGEFERRMVLRERPSRDAPAIPLPLDAVDAGREPWAFFVRDVEDRWMQLESRGSWPSGWVETAGGGGFGQLKGSKLAYVKGVAAYLRILAGRDGAAAPAPAAAERALADAFAGFRAGGESEMPMAIAVASAMQGLVPLLAPSPQEDALARAERLFAEAARLVPYSADLLGLHQLARLRRAYLPRSTGAGVQEGTATAAELLAELGRAVALEPDNEVAVANLAAFYQLLLRVGPPAGGPGVGVPTRAELEQRLAALRAAS